jgi:hypothetical protein
MTARGGHSGQLDVARLPALGAVVVGRGDPEVARTTRVDIATVVARAWVGLVTRGAMAPSGARGGLVVTAIGYPVRRWEVLDSAKTLRRVWHVCTRSQPSRLPMWQ